MNQRSNAGRLRLRLHGHAVQVIERPDGGYDWRVDDPPTSDWSRGQASDALTALRAASAASERLAGTQRAIRGAADDDERGSIR